MFSRYLWRLIIRKFRITPVHHSKESFQKIACLYRFRRFVNYTARTDKFHTQMGRCYRERRRFEYQRCLSYIIVFSAEISVARRKQQLTATSSCLCNIIYCIYVCLHPSALAIASFHMVVGYYYCTTASGLRFSESFQKLVLYFLIMANQNFIHNISP